MAFPSRKAAVVGVYLTEQGRGLPRTAWSLELEAIKGALDDAGLRPDQVDGLIPMAYVTPLNLHMAWTEQLGGKPITYLDVGSGAGAVAKAAAAIDAGLCKVCVIYFGNANNGNGPGAQKRHDKAPRVDDWDYMVHGAYMSVWYAMWTRAYMHQFNVRQEDLAEYSVIARYHATLNPASIMGKRGEITVDDVMNSRPIADPLHLLECPLDNDGGYAIVVAAEDIARDCKKKPIWVLGGAEATYTDSYRTITSPWISNEGAAVRRVGEMAFENSGITHDEIDVAGLYDCFPVTVARDLEELGFCKLGEGADYIKAGHLRLGGKMPSNTDGGLLSHSHNGNPSGMHTIEVVKQLRGECGERQVPDAKIGLTLAQGWAVHGLAGVAIMAAD
ncbi:thiolase family protein [Sphingomonas montanisoli]|uniref:Thiolase family protein n=1 Tax=Sphingomonas montanisoli TaxID=2606412 RepID=A0A5D9C7G2_9SPHN|nr:thiolase family protein [Sphingomonas montanisoli]TZG27694.1 thiolase family protein [Sphingomonas montanisoli]